MANTASAIIFDTTYSRYVNDVQISNAVQNNFNLVFDDHENIYSQNFDTLFTPLTLSKIVNTDRFSSYQYDPQVCFNKNGGSIIIWNDRRSGSIDIYAQVYDSSFNRIGNEILINQNTVEGYFHTKNVKPTSDGNFIIAFSGYGYSNGRLYLQLINSSGAKVGNNILVSDYGANKIAMETNNDNELLLCWFGNYSSINQIQRFDGALKPLSAVKDLFDITTGLTKRNIDISINKNLDILASWIDYDYLNNSYAESYTSTILNKNGKMVAEVHDIPIDLPSYVHLFNYLNDDGSIIFYWQNGYNFYINRVYKFGNGISLTNRFNYYSSSQIPKIFKMENQKAFFVLTVGGMVDAYFLNDYNYTQQKTNIHFFEGLSSLSGDIYNASDFDIRNNKMIFVYESNKNGGSGYDIWCNVQKVDSLNFDKEAKRLAIYEDTMFPIFPNPFNSSTIIAYELKQPTNVKISIYDILGREIDVLVNRFHEAGYNQIHYNATGLASGMYFCVFEAKTTHVQKLLLVK